MNTKNPYKKTGQSKDNAISVDTEMVVLDDPFGEIQREQVRDSFLISTIC